MREINETFLDLVIMEYCGAQSGARVTAVRPDGYSIPMGGGSPGDDFATWAAARFEEGVDSYAQSPSVRKAAISVIVQTYWNSVPIDKHGPIYGPLCARTISAVRSHIKKACERTPLPEFLAAG